MMLRVRSIFLFLLLLCLWIEPSLTGTRRDSDMMENIDKLIRMLEVQVESDPDNPEGWMNLGEAYQARDVKFHEGGSFTLLLTSSISGPPQFVYFNQ